MPHKEKGIAGRVLQFFDKAEDHVRARLSHRPILYSIIGAIGVVLVWKGVWETAELFPWLFGPASILLGFGLLLGTGLLVSVFIGESVIISGLKGEKKAVDKTEEELHHADHVVDEVLTRLEQIEEDVHELQGEQGVVTNPTHDTKQSHLI